MPEISVIMPCYNAEKYLRDSIESILDQTFKDFEFIIINDGSEDSTPEIIDSYNDDRIQVYHQANHGLPYSLNKGLELAQGEFIARMDADDIALNTRFEEQLNFLKKNDEFVLVGSNAIKIDKDGKYVCETDVPTSWEDIESQLPCPQIIHPTILFRGSVAENVGGYPDIPMGEDILFYNKIANYGKLINLGQSLLKYRIHPAAFSRKSKKIKNLTEQMFDEYSETGKVSKDKVEQIKKYRSLDSKRDKVYDYHMLLAKKYLWNNYQPQKSRENIYRIFNLKKIPGSIEPYLLFIMSFLGENVVKNIYQKLK